MMAVLCTLWQCHSEDFTLAENNPKRNNSDFFKHDSSGSLTGRAGVDYVSILEEYNDEHNFLATMPDQEGMPIWEKMIVLDNETNTALLVPLTTDNETLSSIIYVALNAENQVNSTKNIDNPSLENYVYDTTVSVEKREQLFYSFMFVDNLTFGNKTFTNIPSDMFSENTYTEYHRLKIKDIKIEGTLATLIDGKLMFESQCHWEWHCKGGEGMDKCDFCINCFRNVCSNIPVFTDDGPGSIPTGGGGGGGGGNSGGSTTNGPLPPKDPCTLSVEKAFYRLKPNCDVIGGTDTPLMNPCEKIKVQRADNEFSKRQDTLQGKTGLTKETGYIQKWGGSYEYKDNGGSTATSNTLALPEVASNTYIKGYMHTHIDDAPNGETKGIKMFSPADASYLMDLVKNAQNQGHPLSDVYGTMVTSTGNYQIRFTGNQYQIKTFTEADLNYHTEAYSKAMKEFIGNKKSLEMGFLQYIQKEMLLYGITLYRMNSDGTTTEIKLNADKTDTIENNCPN